MYLLNWKPNFLNFLLRNKAEKTDLTFSQKIVFLMSVLKKLPNEAYMPLFLSSLSQYAPIEFSPFTQRLKTRDAGCIQIIGQMLKHIKDVPESYLSLLVPYKDSMYHY
jgi:hypothetical protein